jgi:hypothetical protein
MSPERPLKEARTISKSLECFLTMYILFILTEVGNVTSKRNGVTRYCFSHVLRAITIKTSDNVSYEHRATSKRSDNNFHKPTAITFPLSVEALCTNAKI